MNHEEIIQAMEDLYNNLPDDCAWSEKAVIATLIANRRCRIENRELATHAIDIANRMLAKFDKLRVAQNP